MQKKKKPAKKGVKRGRVTVTVHPSAKFLRPALDKVAKVAAGKLQDMLRNAAAKIPGEIIAPGYGQARSESDFAPGAYVMRNGSIAIVVEPVTLKFGQQMRQTWHGWKGHLKGHPDGEGLVWGLDGKRSDATPAHEHDLIKLFKPKKGKS